MKTNTGVSVAICASLILFVGAGQLQAQFNIFDNFESYQLGSVLDGQGGWFATTDVFMENRPGAPGAGTFADANTAPGGSNNYMSQPYDLSQVASDATVIFEAEIYLVSEGPNRSHNDQIGFLRGQATGGYSNGIYWNTNGGATSIQVLNSSIGGTNPVLSEEAENFDEVIPISIVLDLNFATATYTANGNSVFETGLDFSGFTHVGQIMDLRSGAAEVHSFAVYVPEPSTVMLLGAGLLGIALGWRRHRQR